LVVGAFSCKEGLIAACTGVLWLQDNALADIALTPPLEAAHVTRLIIIEAAKDCSTGIDLSSTDPRLGAEDKPAWTAPIGAPLCHFNLFIPLLLLPVLQIDTF